MWAQNVLAVAEPAVWRLLDAGRELGQRQFEGVPGRFGRYFLVREPEDSRVERLGDVLRLDVPRLGRLRPVRDESGPLPAPRGRERRRGVLAEPDSGRVVHVAGDRDR